MHSVSQGSRSVEFIIIEFDVLNIYYFTINNALYELMPINKRGKCGISETLQRSGWPSKEKAYWCPTPTLKKLQEFLADTDHYLYVTAISINLHRSGWQGGKRKYIWIMLKKITKSPQTTWKMSHCLTKMILIVYI